MGDTATPYRIAPPHKISKELSPWKIDHFKILLPLIISGGRGWFIPWIVRYVLNEESPHYTEWLPEKLLLRFLLEISQIFICQSFFSRRNNFLLPRKTLATTYFQTLSFKRRWCSHYIEIGPQIYSAKQLVFICGSVVFESWWITNFSEGLYYQSQCSYIQYSYLIQSRP